MDFPFKIEYNLSEIGLGGRRELTVTGGLMTLIGPNGSGKSQFLHAIRLALVNLPKRRQTRLLSANRLSYLEPFRSNYNGHTGGTPRYDQAHFGGKSWQDHRLHSETAIGDFHALAERPDLLIKVSERLHRLFGRQMILEWDEGHLKACFTRPGQDGRYSAASEASGLLEIVSLLAALYDETVSMLLLDEPEVSLHPQLQRFLLDEVRAVAGDPDVPGKKLVFMATHSAHMITLQQPEDVVSVLFCSGIEQPMHQVTADSEWFKGKRFRALLAGAGDEWKTALFSITPFLVEGPSDAIVCRAVERKLQLGAHARGVDIVPVMGKGNLVIGLRLLEHVGRRPVILADTDALADDLDLVNALNENPDASGEARTKGASSPIELARPLRCDFCRLVDTSWSDIARNAEQHLYWTQKTADVPDQVARRRAALSTLLVGDPRDFDEEWVAIRQRFDALLEVLAAAGCFVLRRGPIESYYLSSQHTTSIGKPSSAVEEAEEIQAAERSAVEANYGDVVGALRYAGHAEPPDEARLVRETLLSAVTPVLASLERMTSSEDVAIMARQYAGDRASIFSFTLHETDGGRAVEVDLNTGILEVHGFPIVLSGGCNPLQAVAETIIPKRRS